MGNTNATPIIKEKKEKKCMGLNAQALCIGIQYFSFLFCFSFQSGLTYINIEMAISTLGLAVPPVVFHQTIESKGLSSCSCGTFAAHAVSAITKLSGLSTAIAIRNLLYCLSCKVAQIDGCAY